MGFHSFIERGKHSFLGCHYIYEYAKAHKSLDDVTSEVFGGLYIVTLTSRDRMAV